MSGNRKNKKKVNIAIIGLGLMGGSLAKILKSNDLVQNLYGFDLCEKSLLAAKQEKVIDQAVVFNLALLQKQTASSREVEKLLKAVDVIFLCLPIDEIIPYAQYCAQYTKALITDVASVKTKLVQGNKNIRYIGGHPMSGAERNGYTCSDVHLFENAIYVLCSESMAYDQALKLPAKQKQEDLKLLKYLIKGIGATCLELKAEEHDDAAAAISHLPHIVAAALVQTALGNEPKVFQTLAAGGFRDITRIAGSDAELWTGICQASGDKLAKYIEKMQVELNFFSETLKQQQAAKMGKKFASSAKMRNQLLASGRKMHISTSLLKVDIMDQPGSLGELTTLIGEAGISIKNINIQNARQYEGGRIWMYFRSDQERQRAKKILEEKGFDCY